MNTPASAVVPSREAVEEIANWLYPDDTDVRQPKLRHAADMLRTLLAEVERSEVAYITLQSSNDSLSAEVERLNTHAERLSRINREVLAESELLSATVADQAAALAERDKDAERLNWLAENVWMWTPPKVDAPYAMVEIWLDSERKFQVGWKDSVGVASLRTAIDAALAASVSSASEEGK